MNTRKGSRENITEQVVFFHILLPQLFCKIVKMGHLQCFAIIFLLGEVCFFALGVDDFTVQFESQKTCFQENTDIALVVEYTGAGTPDIVQWKFSKMTDQTNTLKIVTAICAAGLADPAFPVSRMNYTCDNTNKTYTTTIRSFSEATDAGTWEVAVSVSGAYTNFKNVTVAKCDATTVAPTTGNTGGLSTGAKAGIGSAVVVVVGIGVTIAVVILKKMGKLPGKGDKGDTSRDVESTRSSPEKAKNKLLNEKKQVHPDSEGKKPFRPQPSPPPEANINHSSNPDKHKTGHVSAGSGLPAIQGADNGPSLTKKTDPLPPIGGTPRTDKTY